MSRKLNIATRASILAFTDKMTRYCGVDRGMRRARADQSKHATWCLRLIARLKKEFPSSIITVEGAMPNSLLQKFSQRAPFFDIYAHFWILEGDRIKRSFAVKHCANNSCIVYVENTLYEHDRSDYASGKLRIYEAPWASRTCKAFNLIKKTHYNQLRIESHLQP